MEQDVILHDLEVTKSFVKKGNLAAALENLQDLVDRNIQLFQQFEKNELNLLISRYNTLNNYWIQGKIEDSFWESRLNKIILTVLQLIELFKEKIVVGTLNKKAIGGLEVKVEFTLKENYYTFNILKKDRLYRKLEEVLQLSKDELKLVIIRKGSVIITFMVIKSRLKNLISLAKSDVVLKKCLNISIEQKPLQSYLDSYFTSFGYSLDKLFFSKIKFSELITPFLDFEGSIFINSQFNYRLLFSSIVFARFFSPRVERSLQYDLRFSNFRKCTLTKTKFINSNLYSSDFKDSKITNNTLFKYSNLNNTNFSNCLLQVTGFIYSELESANFNKAIIKGTAFIEVVLQKADLRNCQIIGCNFDRVDFRDSNLEGCEIENSEFKNSIAFSYQKEQFIKSGADISGIIFQNTNDFDENEEIVWESR